MQHACTEMQIDKREPWPKNTWG